MHLSSGFIVLLASVPSLAVVIPSTGARIVIPLTKRSSSLVDDQGVAQPSALTAELQHAENKVNQGFEAYQKNTGQLHPSQPKTIQRRSTGAAPLTPINGEARWEGPITVGTPPKKFTVTIDTGSSDLFLPGPNCNSSCSGHQIYNPSSSSTSINLKRMSNLGFGDGSTVKCDVFTDTVSVAGLTAMNQSVCAATDYTGNLETEMASDGLIGMGYPELAVTKTPPFFNTLIAQGVTTLPQFGVKLTTAESGSELILGGVNSSLFTGDFATTPVTTKGFWELTVDSVNVNGNAALSNFTAIVDTGTTLIAGPSSEVATFYQAIPGSEDASATVGKGFYSFPCNPHPQVSFTLAGKSFALSPESFQGGTVKGNSSLCVGTIAGSPNMKFWILGDRMLANVYTMFDFGGNQIGFADLA